MEKILLIEDDKFISEMIVRKIEKAGLIIDLAVDAESGMVKIQKEKPDLILLDLVLPGMDGYAFLEKLNADRKLSSIPVFIFSNLGQKDEIDRGIDLGARVFWIKAHHDLNELVQKVKQILKETKQNESSIGKLV